MEIPGDGDYVDLVTFAFSGPTDYDRNQPLYIDAEDPSCALTADEFRFLVRSLIAGFKACGLERGDCVLVHIPNTIIYPALFLSIIGAGAIFAGSNPASQTYELDHYLELSKPKLIITSPEALQTVLDASSTKEINPGQVLVLDTPVIRRMVQSLPRDWARFTLETRRRDASTPLSLPELLSHGESEWLKFESGTNLSKTTPVAMYLTSGTTGLPKAAVHSHHSTIAAHLCVQFTVPYKSVRLLCLPLFYRFGAHWQIHPIRYGEPMYVLPRFDPILFTEAVRRNHITETYVVPTMIHILNRDAVSPVHQLDGVGSLPSMRHVGVAGAAIDAASIKRFQNFLGPQAAVWQIWGMTETGAAFTNRFGEGKYPDSIGKLTQLYEARLINLDNKDVIHQDDSPGELEVRGPGTVLEYRYPTQQPQEGSIKDGQGWFKTGDIAYVKDGYYFMVGRTKEMIKVYGYHVAPAEIESVLLKHSGIEDAAVIGVPLEGSNTEVPRAFVVRSDNANEKPILTAEEVDIFVRKHLVSYKALDGGVIFVSKIPRTVTGKIFRRKLTDMNAYRDRLSSFLGKRNGSS
ncbi:hypothetical protein UA08_06888 [Talaromyces atroroseus]|uniref:Acyl-coenzyme A synthetase n=1 Tax=Talaromyces atroroseus TaxID=1441469 RepID=A0A225AQ88_TALAT|nr:hypothetical protein UA08_06888 [Talaromyces atroroseus]OKL57769.1 hypothetical protein UA08_06888 [Talaromyces atroroseus]